MNPKDEFSSHLRSITELTLGIFGLLLLLWFFWFELRSYFAGFVLGGAVSLLNAHYTAWKIRQIGDLAVTRATEQPAKRRVNIGFFTRASTSLLAILLAIRVEGFEFSTTFAGLFLTQVLSLGVGIYFHVKHKKGGIG